MRFRQQNNSMAIRPSGLTCATLRIPSCQLVNLNPKPRWGLGVEGFRGPRVVAGGSEVLGCRSRHMGVSENRGP